MTVVTDSSPLVILSKIDCFDVLKELFSHLHISVEVHHEVVVAGRCSRCRTAGRVGGCRSRLDRSETASKSSGFGSRSTKISARSWRAKHDPSLRNKFMQIQYCLMTTARVNWPERRAFKYAGAWAFSKSATCEATSRPLSSNHGETVRLCGDR